MWYFKIFQFFIVLCNGTYFKCEETTSTNIICVPLTVVCDGFDDCPSSSDENPSNCFASANSANGMKAKIVLLSVLATTLILFHNSCLKSYIVTIASILILMCASQTVF